MAQDRSGETQNAKDTNSQHASRKWAGIVYLLQILSFAFGGITLIIGLIINYLKRPEVQGTWLESHFTWQITTFWYTLALVSAGLLTFGIFIGYVLLILATIFLVYRVFRGWSRWTINEAIEQSIF
jgi:uncharacterized membrane protein